MATFTSRLVQKKNRHRGVYSGKEQSVTGSILLSAGASIALTDLIQFIPMGENTRPIRLLLQATTTSGNPVLTNPTFNIGVAPLSAANFTRPDGTVYAPLTANASVLSPALVIPANDMIVDIDIPRPVADSVANYAPYLITATPAGVGAFSVAGGNIDLSLTVTFLGEEELAGGVYEAFMNTKVAN